MAEKLDEPEYQKCPKCGRLTVFIHKTFRDSGPAPSPTLHRWNCAECGCGWDPVTSDILIRIATALEGIEKVMKSCPDCHVYEGRLHEPDCKEAQTIPAKKGFVMNEDLILPRFICHKEVGAGKITEIESAGSRSILWFVTAAGREGVYVSKEYVAKHKPVVGGYFVEYEDGYKSFSPAGAFEKGYSPKTA